MTLRYWRRLPHFTSPFLKETKRKKWSGSVSAVTTSPHDICSYFEMLPGDITLAKNLLGYFMVTYNVFSSMLFKAHEVADKMKSVLA